MTARTRLTLHQLDSRDLPSTVAVTVERPAEYATASVAWQQTFDRTVQESLQGVVFDTTVSVVAPLAADAASEDKRPFNPTTEQRDELLELGALQDEIKVRLAQNAAARAQLQTQVDALKVARGVLYADLATAAAETNQAIAASNAFIAANPGWSTSSDPAVRQLGYDLAFKAHIAKARYEGIKAAAERLDFLIENAEARIAALNEQDAELNRILADIHQRIGVVGDSVYGGVPSPPRRGSFTLPLGITTNWDFFDLTRPYHPHGQC